MQRETVAAGWVTADEFADSVALGNSLPGPIAPQVSAFVGYKLAGIWGAIAAAAGTVLPTTMLMLAAIAYFYQIKDSPVLRGILTAVRPVIVGLLLWTTYDVAVSVFRAKSLGWGPALALGWDKVLIAAVAFGLLTFTKVNPAILIFGAAALGLIIYR
jgi:chromate transporter